MLETFCLRLATGLVASLFILPPRTVPPRFYRIHLVIVVGLIAGAGMAVWHGLESSEAEEGWFWLFLGAAAGACLLGSLSWTPEALPSGYGCLAAGLLGLVFALWTLPGRAAGLPIHRAWLGFDDLSSAGLIGLTVTAMLLGHWYLIAPGMSLTPLQRLLGGLYAAVGLRSVAAAGPLAAWLFGGPPFDGLAWAWLALRWGVGIVGLLLLLWMVQQTVRIRSTQSATGILYVAVIFCFFGELNDLLLQSHLQHFTGKGG